MPMQEILEAGLIPGLGRSPGEGNVNPLQYSCLGNPIGSRAWWVTVHGFAKSLTWLSNWIYTHTQVALGQNAVKLFQKYSRKRMYLIQHVTGSACIVQIHFHGQVSRQWVKKVIIPSGIRLKLQKVGAAKRHCKEIFLLQVEQEAGHVCISAVEFPVCRAC